MANYLVVADFVDLYSFSNPVSCILDKKHSCSGQQEEDPDYADGSHGWYWGEAVHLDTPYWGK
jgi:hypothetical protein